MGVFPIRRFQSGFVQQQPDEIKFTKMKHWIFLLGCVMVNGLSQAQDSARFAKTLDSITIQSYRMMNRVRNMPDVQGTWLYAAKSSALLSVAQQPGDMSIKSGRQLLAKIPGVFVYDMDGPGNQLNISLRGLDSHRGWELNTRKDGALINSDMYGYPATHFSIPVEAIDQMELVKGTGSLQYGAQFGGMLHYRTKQPDTTRALGGSVIIQTGSYNLLSEFVSLGGKSGKFSWQAWVYRKTRDGYRDEEHTDATATSLMLRYDFNQNWQARIEWNTSKYQYKIPGPLNDAQFNENPRQATRSRNYFSPDLSLPVLHLDGTICKNTRVELTASALLGTRKSVLFDKPSNVRDSINSITFQYNNRQVDIDRFRSLTTEARLLHQYGPQSAHTLVVGVQYMNNDLHRRQLGKGTTGTDYDLTLTDPVWGRDLHFRTSNWALFAENNWRLGKGWQLNAGFRAENGVSKMSGVMAYYPLSQIPVNISHSFVLPGISVSWKPNALYEFFAAWSQAYRPVLFKDIIPATTYEKVNPGILDSKGSTIEAGWRGQYKRLRWDLTGFYVYYGNRVGMIAETDGSGQLQLTRTNIGNSISYGIECYVQSDWQLARQTFLSVFTATSLLHAEYTNAAIRIGLVNKAISGNAVEAAPGLISRNGISMKVRKAGAGIQWSYTARSFSDPLNTITAVPGTGSAGLIPAYQVWDVFANWQFMRQVELRGSISNLMNTPYFTRRPLMYPGPGIWPSDGRVFNLTALVKF